MEVEEGQKKEEVKEEEEKEVAVNLYMSLFSIGSEIPVEWNLSLWELYQRKWEISG